MKNISEYLVNHTGSYEGKPMVNELFGTLFAGALIAWCLKDNIKTILDAAAQRRKDKWEHQEKMMNQAISAKDGDGNGKSGGLLSGLLGGLGILKMAGDAAEQEKDPVEKEAQKSKLDIIRASYVDESGKERTPEERQKWLQANMSPEDYKQMCETSQEAFLKSDPKSVVDSAQAAGEKITDDDISKEFDKAKEAYGSLGKQLEADAQARRELMDKIKQKEDEKAAKQEELDKAIADATASGDEAAIKQAKVLKAEFNKKMDIEIYNAKKAANDFEANCQTAKALNASNPGREDRIKTAAQKIEDDHKAAMEAANKEISDNGGDPKNTDPKEGEPTTPAGDDETKKKAEEAKKAAEEAEKKSKEADDAKAAADKAVEDAKKAVDAESDPEKKKNLQADLEAKQKAAEEAGKKAEEAKKAAEEAKKAAEGEPAKTEPAGGKEGETNTGKEGETNTGKEGETNTGKEGETNTKTEPVGGKEKEEVKTVDKDGDPDGGKIVKWVNKDGKETFIYYDKDGDSTEVAQGDFEQAKENYKKAMDDVDLSQDDDDEEHKKSAEGGDVDTDADDADGEEVDDGNGGKKKVLKNPAQIWHRKKKKNGGGSTKSYYNKSGDSISQKEFQEKLKKYQAAKAKMSQESVSFKELLSNHYIAESGKQYTSLRDSILENIHD